MNRALAGTLGVALLVLVPASPVLAQTADPETAYAGLEVYYGDLHSHTYYSPDAAQGGWSTQDETPWAALKYARDVAQLDFCCITDHGEQFLMKGGGSHSLRSMKDDGPKGS